MADPALQTPEEQSDALAGKGLQTVMRRALPASAKQPLSEKTEPPPRLPEDVEAAKSFYETLPMGKDFVDPQGNIKTKPWTVGLENPEEDFARVPEGADFVTPEGEIKTKPVYKNVDFTAQTLHGMATNDAERRKALERSYPGKVKQAPDGSFYVVEDDGTRRKPRGALSGTSVTENVLPAAVAGAAPTAGAVAGDILGGIPGAGLGAVLGQGLNDLVLKWAGIYDRSFGEEAKELGTAGALSMAGGAVGRGAAAVIPSAVAGAAAGRAAVPAMAATALGAEKETLQTALRIAEEGEHESSSRLLKSFGMTDPGTPVPISSWAPHAPMLQLEQEVFHPRFFQEQPLKKGRTAFMEKQGKGLLDDIGAQTEGSLTEPESAVSGREAGQKAIDRAMQVSSDRETELRRLADEQRAAATTQAQEASVGHEARMATLREAGQQADVAATRVIDEGYKAIEKDVENAMRTARAGHNSGDFWNSVAQKFRDLRGMIGLRASARYDGWRQQFGSVLPDAGGLAEEAKGFIEELPKSFQENRPALIKQLSKLAGSEGVEPATLDLAEVHKLRSLFRHQIDWSDLPSDIRNGALKRFESQLNQVIHGANVPLAARKSLDDIDKWYGKVMPIWNDKRIQSVVDGIRNGKPADPKELVELMIKEGNTDLNNKLRRMLGPNLWSGIRGAHAENLIRKNRDLFGNVNGSGFARDVLADSNSGLLRSIHGDEGAQRILRQAQHVSLLEGDMPIPVRQGDTALDVINRAREAQKAIEEEAKKNPLGLLKKELQRLNQYERQFLKDERARVGKDPFKFLIDKSFAAKEAAEKIASSEDLIIAYAARVGENSPEWEAMKQYIAKRIFTGTTDPADKLKVISPEVSELVLGAKLQDARRLAKDMEFLKPRPGGAGSSMAATEKVTHPFGSGVVGKAAQAALKLVPASGFGARTVLSEYYDLIAKLAQSPSTMRWVMKGLEGDPQSRQMVKNQIQRWMSRGGTIGAGVGEGARQLVEPTPENSGGGNQIPQFAEGGVVTQPTVAMIGEKGPEAVVPLDNPAAAQQAADVAAARVRAPYAKAQAEHAPSGLLDIGNYYGDKLMSAMMAPHDALTGSLQVTDPETGMPTPEAMKRGQSVANMAMTGGIPMAQRGSAGIFGGKLAKGANLGEQEVAETFAKHGGHPDDIWKETGWFQGSDGQWRHEIPDTLAQFNKNPPASGGKLPELLTEHPLLYSAYPELKDAEFRIVPGDVSSYQGKIGGNHYFMFGRETLKNDPSVVLHEIQHAIQSTEGFAKGGSPAKGPFKSPFDDELRPLMEELDALNKKYYNKSNKEIPSEVRERLKYLDEVAMTNYRLQESYKDEAFSNYEKLSGETEARNVQDRFIPGATPTQHPQRGESVPRSDQIVSTSPMWTGPKSVNRGQGELPVESMRGGFDPFTHQSSPIDLGPDFEQLLGKGSGISPRSEPGNRINFKSAGAQRGESAPGKPQTARQPMTPEEKAEWKKKADAEMQTHLDKMAKTKEGRKIITDLAKKIEKGEKGGERVGFKSLETDK